MKKKINQTLESCCKFMRTLTLSQTGLFVEELSITNYGGCYGAF